AGGLETLDHVAGGGDVERRRGRPRQAARGGRQRVAGAGVVDREVAEGGDPTRDGHGGRAGEGAAGRVGADGHGDLVGVVRGDEVLVGVQHAHGHGRADDGPGGGGRRLLPEDQLAGGGRADRDRGAAGDRAVGRVGGGDGLAARREQRHGEGAHAVGQR